jgi:quinoprotein glucose dehydrogenase
MKKVLKLIFISVLLFISFIIISMTSISTKYVERSLVSFDVNNASNPQMKKIIRKLDNLYAVYLLKISDDQKKHLDQTDNMYPGLHDEKIIFSKKNNFAINVSRKGNNLNDWQRSHGSSMSNRFSDLSQINVNNVKTLDLAWKFKFDEIKRDIQANPVIAENKIFIPTTGYKVIALDAKNGTKIWEHNVKGTPARRGIIYWPGNKNNDSRIYFCVEKELISLSAKTGKLMKSFGSNGSVLLKKRCLIAPVIINDKLIIGTFDPALEVYNLSTGKLLWKYYLKEKKYNKKRYGGKRYDYSGGNPWSGISADIERGIVFLSTGNAGYYFNGVNRPGNNKYSNSVIAIDVVNKKKLWDFQEISHDIWNLDIPAPPILTSIEKNGLIIDVVVAVTKLGNTLVLDRLSGEPIFDFHKKKAPQSKIPGEKTSYYQPNIKIPEPFSKQFFNENEITNISIESHKFIKNKIKNANYGFFIPHEVGKKSIYFGFHGGAEWMGASINNKKGIMYITASNTPWEASVFLKKGKGYYKYGSSFNRLFDQDGYLGSKPPWGTLTALDLNLGKIIWQVPFGEFDELSKKGVPVTGTENYGGATGTAGNLIFATGTIDKKIRAFDSTNGKEVWSYKLPFTGSSPPSIYSIDEEQYIVVAATGSYSLKSGYPDLIEFGNWLYCFKLKK